MRIVRSILLATAALVAMLAPLQHGALAQAYPERTIRMIFPFAAGGGGDTVARIVAAQMSVDLGQQVIVENRPGGGSAIGTYAAARAAPDGYTFVEITGANLYFTLMQENVPYDLRKDFRPIAGIGGFPLVLCASKASGIASLSDLVERSKTAKGGLNYSSGGNGTLAHLSAARLLNGLKVEGTHVPYRGNAEATQAILSGLAQFTFSATADSTEFVKAGSLTTLAVTSRKRVPTLPDVPTTAEIGLDDFDASVWYGFLAPAGTPDEVINRLRASIAKVMDTPSVQDRLKALGFAADVTTPDEFAAFLGKERDRWGQVIRTNGIRIN